MAQMTYHCEVCSSEILGSLALPNPRVCLLCRLSAEEALSVAEADEAVLRRPRLLQPRPERSAASRVVPLF